MRKKSRLKRFSRSQDKLFFEVWSKFFWNLCTLAPQKICIYANLGRGELHWSMQFLVVILDEKSKKHTQKIQKNFLDRVLDIFWPQSPKNMGFEVEVKSAQNTVKKICWVCFLDFSAKITPRKVILKQIFYSILLWTPSL